MITPQEQLMRKLQPRFNRWRFHTPHPRQALFLLMDDCQEVLFGGAAGGGKSDALIECAMQYADIPGYSALILRRTFKDLMGENAILDRALSWYRNHWMKLGATYNTDLKRFTFPTALPEEPATLRFGHMATDSDRFNYDGGNYQTICFDEATQFGRVPITHMFQRLRKPTCPFCEAEEKRKPHGGLQHLPLAHVPLRMRYGSNPGGEGHEFFFDRFFVNGKEGRVFIPSKIEDNPSLDLASYEEMLNELDPVMYAQRRHGDWSIRAVGNMFKPQWFQGKVLDGEPDPSQWDQACRYWDMAATENMDSDWTGGAKGISTKDRRFVISHVARIRSSPGGLEQFVQMHAERDGLYLPIWIEQEGGASGIITLNEYTTRVLKGYTVRGDKKIVSKIVRAQPMSAWCEQGRMYFVRGTWNEPWINELCAFPSEDRKQKDDQVDCTSGAYNKVITGAKKTVIRPW